MRRPAGRSPDIRGQAFAGDAATPPADRTAPATGREHGNSRGSSRRAMAAGGRQGVPNSLRRTRTGVVPTKAGAGTAIQRSEEHTSELQSLMRISYAVFCFKKKNTNKYRDR